MFTKTVRNSLFVGLGTIISFLSTNVALKAADLSPEVAMLVTQSTAYDLDYTSLLDLYGSDYVTNNYSFTSNGNPGDSYVGNLTGTYLGKNLSVQYNGDFSNYSTTKIITWNSVGNYGSDPWIGSGSVQVVGDSTTGFIIYYNSSLNLGSNIIETALFSEGIVTQDSLFQYTGEAGGTITYNGQLVFASPWGPSPVLEGEAPPPPFVPPVTPPPLPVFPPPVIVPPNGVPPRLPGEYWSKSPSLTVIRFGGFFKILYSDVDYNVQYPSSAPPGTPIPPRVDRRYRVMTNFLSTTCDDCTGDGYVRIELIPEPSSILSLLALGTLGAASTFKRTLKPSKSTEKETTKVS
jgi:hypothetical protein